MVLIRGLRRHATDIEAAAAGVAADAHARTIDVQAGVVVGAEAGAVDGRGPVGAVGAEVLPT